MATFPRVLIDDGKRITFSLSEPHWRAVEVAALRRGQKWREWVRDVLRATPPEMNQTAAVRDAAVEALLDAPGRGDSARASDIGRMNSHALMQHNASLNDEELAEIMANATVWGWADLNGMIVSYGTDEHGQHSVWVENGQRHGLHFALVASSALEDAP